MNKNMNEEELAQFWASLALRHTKGLGARSIAKILSHFGSAYVAFENVYSWESIGIKKNIIQSIQAGSWRTTAIEEWRNVTSSNIHILMWHHDNYPKLLKNIVDAPSVLYCLGDLSLLSSPCLAVIGSRNCSTEGVQVASDISNGLAKSGITIVSGLADGIDRVAHLGAIEEVGSTIAILGTGIDRIYPQKNTDLFNKISQKGLIISEFAPGTSPLSSNFPIRNRLISGLSLGVLVVESSLHSGTLITAKQALEQNREIYAIPGPTTSEKSLGCQDLIRQGAKAVFNAQDILQDIAQILNNFNNEIFQNTIDKAKDNFSKPALKTTDKVKSNSSKSTTDKADDKPSKPVLKTTKSTQSSSQSIFSIEDLSCDIDKARQVLTYLLSNSESNVDTISLDLNINISELNVIMLDMELMDYIKRLPGGRYVACHANI